MRMFKLNSVVSLLTLSAGLVTVGCKGGSVGSSTKDLAEGLGVGDASARHGKREVLVYYSNETAPSGEELANYERIIAALDKLPRTRFIADSLKKDMQLFPMIVDEETKALKDYLCSDKNKAKTGLMIFTNRGVRNGVVEYCKDGGPVKKIKYDYMSYLRANTDDIAKDYRYENNPLSHQKALERALVMVRSRFPATTHLYSLITKSHGNKTHYMVPRLMARTDLVPANEIAEELAASLPEPAAETESVSALDRVQNQVDRNRSELAQSSAKIMEHLIELARNNRKVRNELFKNELIKNELLKNELLKNELFKNELVKNELLKNELIKNELLKNELIKNELVKNELIKNELLKNELFKNELIKNELLKNELIKNELFKNELFKNELIKNELVKNELVKNELLKNELIKNELVKNELMKNELFKNELVKNELLKNELIKNELAKEALLKNELAKEHLAAEGETAGSSTRVDSKVYRSTNPKVGIAKGDYLNIVVGSGFNSDADKDMHFSVVFTESCSSEMAWNHLLDFAEASEAAKIDWMFSSDEGSLGYSTIKYESFLSSIDKNKSFGEQLKNHLNDVAKAQANKTPAK